MPKAATVTPIIKKRTLEYLKELYEKSINGTPLTAKEVEICQYQSSLAKYMCDILYDDNGNPLTTVPTIKSAIKNLVDNGFIEQEKNDILRYVPPKDELVQKFPILNIASLITVTPLNVEKTTFLRVPENYSAEIAKYLNSVFPPDDIQTISLGSVIMCLSMTPPEKISNSRKKKDVQKRVLRKLVDFKVGTLSAFDSNLGYTEEELNLLEQEEKAQAQEIKYDESLFTVPGASKFKRDQRIPVDISEL